MKIQELETFLADEITYPIDREEAIHAIGDLELESPQQGDSSTVGMCLERLNEGTYDTPDELFHAIVGTLGDAFIGRKYYDDRGTNPPAGNEFPANESF